MIYKKHAESPFYSVTPLIGLQTGKYMLNYNCRGDKLPNTIEQGVIGNGIDSVISGDRLESGFTMVTAMSSSGKRICATFSEVAE